MLYPVELRALKAAKFGEEAGAVNSPGGHAREK
jgi:hypothetical protein